MNNENPLANMSEHQTEEALRFEELDRIAFDFGRIQGDTHKLYSLYPEEHAYVMSMGYLYAMYRLDAVSAERAKEIKQLKRNECSRIHNQFVYMRHLHSRWILCTKLFGKEHKELVEMIKNSDPQALKKALKLLDDLSGMYIYTGLYEKAAFQMDTQQFLFDDLIDDVADETNFSGDHDDLKRIIAKIIEEIENGNMPDILSKMTDEEVKRMTQRLPEKEPLSEELIKELMPRTK